MKGELIWLSVFSSPFIVVVVVIHSDWYDCCHLTISFQFSFHCFRGCELLIRTTTTVKGELKTDSQMTTIIPVTMDHFHCCVCDPWWLVCLLSSDYQFSVLLSLLSWLWSISDWQNRKLIVRWQQSCQSLMDHNHDNNERRTENW
jgi:hypothetical protein